MKKLTILTLTATLAACGGGSPSTQSNTNSDDIEKPDIELLTAMAPPGGAVSSGYDNSKCSNSLETTSNALVVNGSSQNVKIRTSTDTATATIGGSSADVCIDGNLALLNVTGSSADVWVNGNVGAINITGTSADVVVYGSIGALRFTGSSADVWTNAVGTYDDYGSSNDIMKISIQTP